MSNYSARSHAEKRTKHRRSRSHRFLRFLVFTGALASALLMAFHSRVPDVLGLGLLLDNAAPWMALTVPVLFLLALASRSRTSLVALLIPILTWLFIFGPAIVPLSWSAPRPGPHTLTLSSQNIQAGTGAAPQSALELANDGSDVIALQELDAGSASRVSETLGDAYPHHFVVGTVGVWSKYPLTNARPLELGLGWKRALSIQVDTGHGSFRLYVIHAASARPNNHVDRDEILTQLAEVVQADPDDNMVVIGDFNATSTDRAFKEISTTLDEPNQDDGLLGFTWPRSPFTMMRLDHALVRGLEVTSNTNIEAGLSDHLAVRTVVNLPGE